MNVTNYGRKSRNALQPSKTDFHVTSSSRYIRRYLNDLQNVNSIHDDRKDFISSIDEAFVKKTWPKNSAVSTRAVKILNQNEIDRQMQHISDLAGRVSIPLVNLDNDDIIKQKNFEVRFFRDRPSVAYNKNQENIEKSSHLQNS